MVNFAQNSLEIDLKNKVVLVLKAADFGGKFDVLSNKSSSRILGRFK